MVEKYMHTRVDQTARALVDFSKSLMKLISLNPGQSCILRLEYDDAPHGTSNTEVIVFVNRDEEAGHYYFNNVQIDNLDEAIQVWSMACASVLKPIASDENREDDFEDLGEAAIPDSLQEIMDAYSSSDNEDTASRDDDSNDENSAVEKFLSSSAVDADDLDEEAIIYEEYDGLTLELKHPREDDPSNNEVIEDE